LVQVALERLWAAFRRDLAEAEHVDIARHFYNAPHVMVDEQDRHVLPREEVDPLIDLLGDFRRKPDAGLVDQAEPRPHQVSFREPQHLLLAAGEIAGLAVALVPERGEFLVHVLEPARDLRLRDAAVADARAACAARAAPALAPREMLE